MCLLLTSALRSPTAFPRGAGLGTDSDSDTDAGDGSNRQSSCAQANLNVNANAAAAAQRDLCHCQCQVGQCGESQRGCGPAKQLAVELAWGSCVVARARCCEARRSMRSLDILAGSSRWVWQHAAGQSVPLALATGLAVRRGRKGQW